MIDPTGRPLSTGRAAMDVSVGGQMQSPKSQSFAAVFSGELTIQPGRTSAKQVPADGQSPSQELAPRRNPGVPSTGSTRAPIPPPSLNTAPAPTSAPTGSTEAQSASASFDQAYWASQPAAVQQLQTVNPADRMALATQLANEGYTIDVPIMVWGWDPATTMAERQALGYTWVPSALQQPIAVAPGLNFNGQSYNPSNPPPGSITVT